MQSQRTAIVLDGQPFVAYGIAGYLKSHCGFTAAYTLTNAQDLWAYLATTPPLYWPSSISGIRMVQLYPS